MARPTLRRTGDDQRPPAGQPPSRPARRPLPTPCVVTALVHDRRTAASGRRSGEANRPPPAAHTALRTPDLQAFCHDRIEADARADNGGALNAVSLASIVSACR